MTLEEKLKIVADRVRDLHPQKCQRERSSIVGKAKNLRNRVGSIFSRAAIMDPKTRQLVKSLIADFEFIVVDNEVEALVLESNLIKKHKPRFNVLLKDDKSYPHLKLTNEPFPKVVITRKIVRDGSNYYGPFLPASLARKTLNLVNRAFQLRTCEIEIDGKLPRPCLEYHLKRCLGPCVKGLCTQDEYQEAAADVKILLEGKNKELAKTLEQRMWQFSDEGKYEIAAKYRDLHRTVLALSETAKDGDDRRTRRRHNRVLSRKPAARASAFYNARRGGSSAAANFFGKTWPRTMHSMRRSFSARSWRNIIRPITFRSRSTCRRILRTAPFSKSC